MKRRDLRKPVAGLGLLAMLLGTMIMFTTAGAGASHNGEPPPDTIVKNPACPADTYEFKFDSPFDVDGGESTRTVSLDGTDHEVTISYVGYVPPGEGQPRHYDWTISSDPAGVAASQVIVKQGSDGALFNYDPPGTSGTVYVQVTGNSDPQGTSHMSFCLGEAPAPCDTNPTAPNACDPCKPNGDDRDECQTDPCVDVDPVPVSDCYPCDPGGDLRDECQTDPCVDVDPVPVSDCYPCDPGGDLRDDCQPEPPCTDCSPTPTPVPAKANLEIIKVVTGDDALTQWSYDFAGALGDFTLTDDAAANDGDLVAGVYTVSESDAANLTGVDCGDEEVEVDLAAGSVAVTLEPGEQVSCTFTNTYVAEQVTPPTVLDEEVIAEADVTTPVAVEDEQVTAAVETLPRTGSENQRLAVVGVALVLFGAVLVGGSRSKELQLG